LVFTGGQKWTVQPLKQIAAEDEAFILLGIWLAMN
jgi:hypothetical protein